MFGIKMSKAFTGVLALFVLAATYGFIGYFARELAPGLSLWQQTYIRLLLGVPFLYLTFHKKINLQKCLELLKRERYLMGLRSLCLYILSVPLFFYAVQNANLGNVALLQVLPYMFILGVFINKEKITLQKVLLMLLAVSGAYLIAVKSGLDFSHMGRGELASLVSGLLFSLGFILRKRHKTTANNYELSFTLVSISAVLLVLISLLAGDGLPHPTVVDLRFWIILIVAGYINAIIIILANHGFQHVKDTLAGNILALEGAFGILSGYLIYNEVPVWREVIGAVIIMISAVGSAYLVRKSKNQ